ncbi:MAG: thioredoxin domain-containing protein [Deltaproteobacteria bacterium]|nr:thioredoxin domain-containing protein [Deltaproteobacteria bacterium]
MEAKPIQRPYLITAFILSLLALGSSFYLTYLHLEMMKQGSGFEAFCDINSTFNCSNVLASSYSRLGPFPISGFALAFYLYLSFSLFWSFNTPSQTRNLLIPPLLLCLANLGVSLAMAWISYHYLGNWCLFCSSLYVLSFLIYFSLKKGVSMPFKKIFSEFFNSHWLKSYVSLILIHALVLGGVWFLEKDYAQAKSSQEKSSLSPQNKKDSEENTEKDIKTKAIEYVQELLTEEPKTIPIEGRPIRGNKDAKIVVAEFSDFECPYCKKAAVELKKLLKPYEKEVSFVFFNYPLDQACHPSLSKRLHVQACNAAYYAHCAKEQGKFWEYHDTLFTEKEHFSEEVFKKVAKEVNLDSSKLESCVASEETKKAILEDLQLGINLKIRGTPTVFVNGYQVRPWFVPEVWETLIPGLQ